MVFNGEGSNWLAYGLRSLGAELTKPGAPWRAKSIWAAAVITVLGTGFWQSDEPAPQPAPQTQEVAEVPADREKPASPPRGTSRGSSAAVSLGLSYIGGFLLGWCYRRFLKLSAVLTGGVLAVLMAIRGLGWFDGDMAALQEPVREGAAWLGSQAAALDRYLTGLLPSAGAAGIGMFRGFRRKRVPAAVAEGDLQDE